MKKRLILTILVIIFLISIVNATPTKTYNMQDTTKSNNIAKNPVQLYIYGCGNYINCSNFIFLSSGISSYITPLESNQLTITLNPETYNAEFFYDSADCYPPYYVLRGPSFYNPPSLQASTEVNLKLKQSTCQSYIPSINYTQIGNGLIINFNLNGVNYDNQVQNLNLPSQVKSWYDTKVMAYLYINDQKVNEKEITVPKEGKSDSFVYTLQQSVTNYKVRVESKVTDCKCSCSSSTPDCGVSSNGIEKVTVTQTCSPSYTSWTTNCIQNSTGQYNYNRTIYYSSGCTSNITEWQTCSTSSTITSSSCSDSTSNNSCSLTTRGKFCDSGNLIDKCSKCTCLYGYDCINEQCIPKCIPKWDCTSFSKCENYNQIRTCTDTKECNTEYNKPATEQYCSMDSQLSQTDNTDTSTIPVNPSSSLNIKFDSGIYWIIGLILIVLAILSLSLFFLNKKPKEVKEIIKPEDPLKPVKVTDLLTTTINSLEEDEKFICNKLIEGEGIKEDDLRKITGLTKQRMQAILSRLERRQIIKERDEVNSKIFFNDWLK